MCKDKCNFIVDDEWVVVRGVSVPKRQLEEAQQKLYGLMEETEKTFDIKDLCRRNYEEHKNNGKV